MPEGAWNRTLPHKSAYVAFSNYASRSPPASISWQSVSQSIRMYVCMYVHPYMYVQWFAVRDRRYSDTSWQNFQWMWMESLGSRLQGWIVIAPSTLLVHHTQTHIHLHLHLHIMRVQHIRVDVAALREMYRWCICPPSQSPRKYPSLSWLDSWVGLQLNHDWLSLASLDYSRAFFLNHLNNSTSYYTYIIVSFHPIPWQLHVTSHQVLVLCTCIVHAQSTYIQLIQCINMRVASWLSLVPADSRL